VTPGVRRLLLRVFKWVVVPALLLLIGYVWIGPHLVPSLMNVFLGQSSAPPGPPSEGK
jgi:hypothetical protein